MQQVLLSLIFLSVTVFAAEDARYIRCVVPDTVITDEVFQADIVMYNNGTTVWGATSSQTPVTLVSQSPVFNMMWGTYFIILGQGRTINPGDTCIFSSRLKAPSTPGNHNFGWQIERWVGGGGSFDTTTPFFGDTITGVTIHVKQRTETRPQASPHIDTLLDSADLEYAGSFKLPGIDGQEARFTECGITLKTDGNEKHVIVRAGSHIYESSIPTLVKAADGSAASVNTGSLIRDWGQFSFGTIGGETIESNCGFWFDDSSQILYWNHHHPYYTQGVNGFPHVMATRLNANGTHTNIDYWYIPDAAPRYKSYWWGITKLSKRFADEYTGGRTMAAGFGGYYSICQTASRGPGLGAFALPDTNDEELDLIPLISYAELNPAPREGNYLPVVGFWGDNPASPWEGTWSYNDICKAGVFIDLPDKKGYVAFVSQQIGRIGYDYGGYNTDSHNQNNWYFYDQKDIGAVASGIKSLDSIRPSSYVTVTYPVSRNETHVTGACFDSSTRLLYLYTCWAQENADPIVHVYYVKDTTENVIEAHDKLKKGDLTISAFPNPFNPAVTITIKTERSRSGQVRILDLSGRMIADISSRLKNGTIAWDASYVPSGTYIILAAFDGTIVSKKVTLLK